MKRSSGILLHISSLPSKFGIGDLGPEAFNFADFLHLSNQKYWQILPISPTQEKDGFSPYSSFSAFAANPTLISPEKLVVMQLITPEELVSYELPNSFKCDLKKAHHNKLQILKLAFKRIKNSLLDDFNFTKFLNDNSFWLNDYALFAALKKHFENVNFTNWPDDIKYRNESALKYWGELLASSILFHKFCQWIFFIQFGELKDYLATKDIKLIGDVPIYVNHDSVDVWANNHIFKIDDNFEMNVVSGVPPDNFSDTGQKWGNPVYNWNELRNQKFSWWLSRINHSLGLFDWVRLDHFRGFEAYYEIPKNKLATEGYWVKSYGAELFTILEQQHHFLPIIAEDLGHITREVSDLKESFDFPGMVMLQFSFNSNIGHNRDSIHNHTKNSVAYTGSHDNNTNVGWYKSITSTTEKQILLDYLGLNYIDPKNISWILIHLLMSSVSNLIIIQVQDLLSLDESHRMNTPSTTKNNWNFMLQPNSLNGKIKDRLIKLCKLFGR